MAAQIRRALVAAAVFVTVVLLVGATYQGVATALERRDFPPPGHKIDVGGHQLHIYCSGEGAPAVILEAPATGMSAAWAWVQPALATETRVCSYDRAGLGWSEAGDGPYDPRNVPEELRTLITRANVARPFILVGHSLGAAFARLYAARYPQDVAAAVLLDAPFTDSGKREPPELDTFVRFMRYSPWLARAGVLRATRLLSSGARGLPEPAGGAVGAFLNRPDHLTRAGIELDRWEETVNLAVQATLDMGIPVRDVRTTSAEAGALLTDKAAADAVTAQIRHVLSRARAGR